MCIHVYTMYISIAWIFLPIPTYFCETPLSTCFHRFGKKLYFPAIFD